MKAPDEISYNAVIRCCSSLTLSCSAWCGPNAVLRSDWGQDIEMTRFV